MDTITQPQLLTMMSQCSAKDKDIKYATGVIQGSRDTATSISTTIEQLSKELLNASIAQSDIPDKLQVAHSIKTKMLELESSAKDLALQFAQIAPKFRDVQPNGPRITSKKPQKATFGLFHRKDQKLKDLGDSNETLVGEEEKAKTDDATFTDGGASLSDILENMCASWNSVSVDIRQVIDWLDLRWIYGGNQDNSKLYTLSKQIPREKSEAIVAQLLRYYDTRQ